MVDYMTALEDITYISLRRLLNNVGLEDTPIYHSHTNAVDTRKTYCSIDVLDMEQHGSADESKMLLSVGEMKEVISHHKLMVQLTVIGEDAKRIGGSLHWSLQNDARAYDAFAFNKVKLFGVGRNLRKAPQLREDRWEDGRSFDFSLSTSLHVKYTYDSVGWITLNGEQIKVPYKNN